MSAEENSSSFYRYGSVPDERLKLLCNKPAGAEQEFYSEMLKEKEQNRQVGQYSN